LILTSHLILKFSLQNSQFYILHSPEVLPVNRFSKTTKRFALVTVMAGAIALSAPLNQIPVIGQAFDAAIAIAQNAQRPDVKLNLMVERRDGDEWQSGSINNARPGDVLRYNLKGKNQGNRAANNFTLTQVIPSRTTYVAQSATGNAQITFSIDKGKTYSPQPMIVTKRADGTTESRPAPAETYTHVRWKFQNTIEPGANVSAFYQVRVR
jgi:uncharacterized repeat protein (TIGR01451 family)